MEKNLTQEQLYVIEVLRGEMNSKKEYFKPIGIEYASADLKGGVR